MVVVDGNMGWGKVMGGETYPGEEESAIVFSVVGSEGGWYVGLTSCGLSCPLEVGEE